MTNIVLVWRFFYSIFQFLWHWKLIRVKRHSAAWFFHRNPLNVCKTSFRRSEYCLDISLPRRRVKISRWLFPSILLRVFLLTSLYAIFCRWVSFLTDHSTPDLASTSYKGLVKFQFREKWRKEVLKNSSLSWKFKIAINRTVTVFVLEVREPNKFKFKLALWWPNR